MPLYPLIRIDNVKSFLEKETRHAATQSGLTGEKVTTRCPSSAEIKGVVFSFPKIFGHDAAPISHIDGFKHSQTC